MSGISNGEFGSSARVRINAILAREFETVAALVADDLLTYSGGQPDTIFAGVTVKTRAGDHAYTVLASDASTFDLQTAGGVKLSLLPTDDGVYHFDGMNPTKNNTGDNLAKFNAILAKAQVVSGSVRILPEVIISYGTYAFSDTINLKCVCRLVGKQATFTFPAATAGMIVNRFNTFNATTDSSIPFGADTSEIIGINFVGGRGSAFDATKSGLWLRARATVIGCEFSNFAGHGLYAAAGSDGNPYLGNCNLSRVEKIRATGCRGSACHIEGTDANAGTFDDIDGIDNDQWCVYEDSFLGNSHRGHHSYGNLQGSYFADNLSVFVGCYTEDGVGGNVETNGPLFACSISQVNSGPGPQLQAEFANGPKTLSNLNGGFRGRSPTISADLGTEGNVIMASRHSTTGISYPFRVMWEDNASGVFIRWASSATRLLNFNGASTANTYGRSAAVGESLNIPGYFLGVGSSARFRGTGTAPPTTGVWARGDEIENINIASGQPTKWGCSVAGTPGTWIAGPLWP